MKLSEYVTEAIVGRSKGSKYTYDIDSLSEDSKFADFRDVFEYTTEEAGRVNASIDDDVSMTIAMTDISKSRHKPVHKIFAVARYMAVANGDTMMAFRFGLNMRPIDVCLYQTKGWDIHLPFKWQVTSGRFDKVIEYLKETIEGK